MRILYLDNFDSFADLLAGEITKLGHEVRKYDSSVPVEELPETFDTLLLGPGPNDPSTAGNYLAAIQKFEEKPIRGVCLGFQAVNRFYYGILTKNKVCHGKIARIKTTGKGIFENLDQELEVARYNSLGVRKEHLADCLELTAYEGDLVMAYQHKNKDISAIQFHPESILSGANGTKILENMFK
jgi:anthranilate synthase/aminodeoxychorismate synthase-like glutamine amidotransferase